MAETSERLLAARMGLCGTNKHKLLKMNQQEAVIQTIEQLGGMATLAQLNQEVFKIKNCVWKTKTPFASIRRIVQLHKDIVKLRPGLYALKQYQKQLEGKGIFVETEKNKCSQELLSFNHTFYQGILLEIGNMKQYETFAPYQDKNKFFSNKKLGEVQTLMEIPKFSYSIFVNRASTIDTIWFNKSQMPTAFFEVEHSTDIQNSLLKFNDLQGFYTKMFIVADKKREEEFQKKFLFTAFENLRKNKRVSFLSYEKLEAWYSAEIALQKFDFNL